MTTSFRSISIMAVLTATVGAFAPPIRGAEEPARLIVNCQRPCQGVEAAVLLVGGEVTYSYENVDAVAVSVPQDRVADISAAEGVLAVTKDVIVNRPSPIEPFALDTAAEAQGLDPDALPGLLQTLPDNYNYNNLLTRASEVQAGGALGQNVVVAVIDTGAQLLAPALSAGSTTVIGGENFVPAATDPVRSATSRLNEWHGTSVSTMIASHVAFVFPDTSTIVRSLRVHSPESVIPCTGPPSCAVGNSLVPMIGTAPAAKVYAMKVFPSQGGGAPTSWIVAAMDRAITLRRNFNNGMPSTPVSGTGTEDNPFVYNSLNIQVVNMSLGGPTLFAGHQVEEELTEALRAVGIFVAAAAGNGGFGAMTVEAPGSGFGALRVAAASTPVHERVLRDNQLGVGAGLLYRPSDEIQTAYFSSRGPIADGRTGPQIIANGFASYTNAFAGLTSAGALVSCGAPTAVAGSCQSRILFVSGTSFSTPTVAGAAALLRGWVPEARPSAIQRALLQGANKSLLGDDSTRFDRGAGFLDVHEALHRLGDIIGNDDCGDDGDDVRQGDTDRSCRERDRRHREDGPDEVGAGGASVIQNVRDAGLSIAQFRNGSFSAQLRDLKPGEVKNFFIPVTNRTDRLTIRLTQITPEGPENLLFGDDLLVMGLDAPTSVAVHRIGESGVFVATDATFVVDNPQTGLFRLAVQGDWTNNSLISAHVEVVRTANPLGDSTAAGPIAQDDVIPITVDVPAGVSQAVFELFWQQNWGRYPTNDLDMLIVQPNGTALTSGATLNSPERVVVANPAAGRWTVLVDGFIVWDTNRGPRSGTDRFVLRVSADGKPIQGD